MCSEAPATLATAVSARACGRLTGVLLSWGSRKGTTACGRCETSSRRPLCPCATSAASAERMSCSSAGAISCTACVPMLRSSVLKLPAAASRTACSASQRPVRT